METWKPVPGFDGYYEVSDLGRIRSVDRVIQRNNGTTQRRNGKVLRPGLTRGYPHLNLCKNGELYPRYVHTLVLQAFVGECPENMECLHKDGNPKNARLENLRWGTSSENSRDIIAHGNNHNLNKTHCPRGHLLVEPNLIKHQLKRGGRVCLACNRGGCYARYHGITDIQAITDSYYEKIMREA
jgi:hypothetical protein